MDPLIATLPLALIKTDAPCAGPAVGEAVPPVNGASTVDGEPKQAPPPVLQKEAPPRPFPFMVDAASSEKDAVDILTAPMIVTVAEMIDTGPATMMVVIADRKPNEAVPRTVRAPADRLEPPSRLRQPKMSTDPGTVREALYRYRHAPTGTTSAAQLEATAELTREKSPLSAQGNDDGVGVAVDVPVPEEDCDVDGEFVAVTLMEAVDDSDIDKEAVELSVRDVVREGEAPNECVTVTAGVMLELAVTLEDNGRGSTSLHVGGAVPENPEMDVEKMTKPAASRSCTVSPMSRYVQPLSRPHTSMEATTQGSGS